MKQLIQIPPLHKVEVESTQDCALSNADPSKEL